MTKNIDIKEQPRLGFQRTFHITTNGIRYRLFRSSITVVVITVAVAFLMNIVTEGLIKQAVAAEAGERLREYRTLASWMTRLTSPSSPEGILNELAAAGPGSPALAEAARLGGLDPDETARLHRQALQAREYLTFFQNLDYGRLRLLTRGRNSIDVFAFLSNDAHFAEFEGNLAAMQTIRFPTPTTEFRDFLTGWPTTNRLVTRVRDGQRRAIAVVQTHVGERRLRDALGDATGSFGSVIRDAGFHLPETTAVLLASQSSEAALEDVLAAGIENTRVRQAMAARLNLLPQEITTTELWVFLSRTDQAGWYLGLLTEENAFRTAAPEPAAVTALSGRKLEENRMLAAERLSAETSDGGFLGLGQRMGWLVMLSLVVCVVGIANAMLMSVTERYREIATFKCLGALDASIMLIFVIEAAILGSVGGFIGSLLGTLLGFGRMLAMHGGLVWESLPLTTLSLSVIFAVFTGIILAALASVYPSLKAARLAPMEAMRIE